MVYFSQTFVFRLICQGEKIMKEINQLQEKVWIGIEPNNLSICIQKQTLSMILASVLRLTHSGEVSKIAGSAFNGRK